MKFKTSARSSETDTTDWLDDLPPAAVLLGRTMLKLCVIDNREAFRRYLTAFAALEALPRTTDTPPEVLQWQCSVVSHLLADVGWRWR